MTDFSDLYASKARRHLIEGRRKFATTPRDLTRFDDPGAEELRKRLATVQKLLDDGRDAEAILFTRLAAWKDLTRAEDPVAKANFNPTSRGTNIIRDG